MAEVSLIWMEMGLTDDKSTLVQVINGLIPSCAKPKLTQVSVIIVVSLDHNELNDSTCPMKIYFPCVYATRVLNGLIHYGLVTPYGNKDLGQHWLR